MIMIMVKWCQNYVFYLNEGHLTSSYPIIYYLFCRVRCIRVDSDLLLVVAVAVTADNTDNDNGKNGAKMTIFT